MASIVIGGLVLAHDKIKSSREKRQAKKDSREVEYTELKRETQMRENGRDQPKQEKERRRSVERRSRSVSAERTTIEEEKKGGSPEIKLG